MSKIICPFCEMEINENDGKYICPDCETVYHKECWEIIDDCENCKKINSAKSVENQEIEIIQSAPNNFNVNEPQFTNNNPSEIIIQNYSQTNTPNKKKKIVAIGIVIAVIIALIALLLVKASNESTIDFSTKYSYMADEPYCTIASDGSYIHLDSNPYNYDDDSYLFILSNYTSEVWSAVEQINVDLGFTEAVSEHMKNTNSLQGKQVEENDKYKITWSYHPDNGFEVIYEKK